MNPSVYHVVWRWRTWENPTGNYVDVVSATDAQRAINKVKKNLADNYSDANRQFVPLEVIKYNS